MELFKYLNSKECNIILTEKDIQHLMNILNDNHIIWCSGNRLKYEVFQRRCEQNHGKIYIRFSGYEYITISYRTIKSKSYTYIDFKTFLNAYLHYIKTKEFIELQEVKYVKNK